MEQKQAEFTFKHEEHKTNYKNMLQRLCQQEMELKLKNGIKDMFSGGFKKDAKQDDSNQELKQT